MSKIVPKYMQSPSSQQIMPNQSTNKNADSDVMFATLFVGVKDETSTKDSSIDGSLMASDFGDESSFGGQTNDDLMALLALLHGGRGLGQKIAGLQGDNLSDDLELEGTATLLDSENPDALALLTLGIPSTETQGRTTVGPRSRVAGLASMIFEDGVGRNAAAATVVSENPIDLDENSLIGQNKVKTKFIGTNQLNENSTKAIENLDVNIEDPLTKKKIIDEAKLRGLRALNLEQQNVDIDDKATKFDPGEHNGKSKKSGSTFAGLKQMMVLTTNQPPSFKVASIGDGVRATIDVTRLAAASSNAFDSALTPVGTVTNTSSTGQQGGQTGQQGNSQGASQFGNGLLGNLNNLQILDTAKDNWTEMLLTRVKKGLSGGKDQLDFQLNPRNLGKMRVRLVMQNDRTNIQIQTETFAAASLLSDSESRLAQMLEASGLRLGNLNSGQFQGFGGAGSDQQANQESKDKTRSLNPTDDAQSDGDVVEELVTEGSDNLINIQA